MSVFGDTRQDYVQRLRVAVPQGVAVTANPAAGPPMILVDLITGVEAQGVGSWRCEVPIKCIVPPPGDASAAALLERMAEHVIDCLGFAPFVLATYRPTTEIEAPMYVFTYPTLVPNPKC